MQTAFTLDELRRFLAEAAGADDGMTVGAEEIDTEFEELGYDSLALMETGSRIERAYGVSIAEEDLAEARTPRVLIDLVNKLTVVA